MTEQGKHTALPWYNNGKDISIRSKASGEAVAYIIQTGLAEESEQAREAMEANLALIVRAVNSHEALVEALREAILWASSRNVASPQQLSDWRNALEMAGEK